MKKGINLAKLWIKKAENDLVAAEHLLTARPHTPYDTICFHAQQCAEKYLKAFLIFHLNNIKMCFPRQICEI